MHIKKEIEEKGRKDRTRRATTKASSNIILDEIDREDTTNKFLEGEDLPDDYFIVQFGDGPEDGGEDFEEDEAEPEQKKITLAA